MFEYKKDFGEISTRGDVDIGIVYKSTKEKSINVQEVDLLLIDNKHYATITDFNKFAISQYRQYVKTKLGIGNFENLEKYYQYPSKEKREELIKLELYGNELQLNACRNCMTVQTTLNASIQHHRMCYFNEPGNAKMPNEEIRDKIRNVILETPVEKRDLCTNFQGTIL